MNPTWEDPIPDEDDDEAAYVKEILKGRDGVIFLIDASSGMFEMHEEDTPFHLCLKCARTTLTNKIICSSNDVTGIIFYGTEKTRNKTDFKHVYVLQDLGEPGAEKIIEIEQIMSWNQQAFSEQFGHSTDYSLADALWVCGIMFSRCSFTLAGKRILLFTNNDSPHDGNSQLQLQAKIKAKDLHESDIDIELMHLQKSGQAFDLSKFYKDITCYSEDGCSKLPDPAEKFDDLLTRVRSKDHKKRALGSFKLTLGEGVEIALKMYKLVVPTPKPTPAKLDKDTNGLLTSVSRTFLSDTAETLLPAEIRKCQEYGGRKIYISMDEYKQIKRFYDPGLLLLGFKPASSLKTHYHIKPSVFLYPDEKKIEGSNRLFFALLIQCQKRNYVPICRMISRQNEPPKFVGLLPQQEHVDDRGCQTIPPGFHVVYLPFMEDIRSIKPDTKHNPSEPLVDKAKEIIKKLQFAYHPESFENPVLQKHWRNIEALALNRDAPEEIIDYTLPTKDVIEKRAGKLIEEFKMLLCPNLGNPHAGDKRATGSQYGSSSKRVKVEEIEVPVSLQQEAMFGTLARFKVNVLKEFCKRNGIRGGTKKQDLIDAIKSYYQDQGSSSGSQQVVIQQTSQMANPSSDSF